MYTNIDNDLGIEAIKEALPNLNAPFDSIVELLEIILTSNDFLFNGQWYLQTRGTAMGVDFAPHYCDIVMAKFEREALAKCPHKPHTYFRYLDDIVIVWQHGHAKFQEFLDILNSHCPPIRFKSEIHPNSVSFLDTTVFKDPQNDSQLLTKVFFKPTDTHQLLHKCSFHPNHTFKGIMKSQITRFFRICSRPKDVEEAWSILARSLRHRKYSKRHLSQIKRETMAELIDKQLRENQSNPGSSSLGAKRCHEPRCATCTKSLMTPCSNFTGTSTGKTFAISSKLDCSSVNVVYLMQCKFCKIQYVGETQNTFRSRMNRHRSAIICANTDSALYNHLHLHFSDKFPQFCESDISLESFLAMPIEQPPYTEDQLSINRMHRLCRESYWIKTLDTLAPLGLNLKIKTPQPDNRKNRFLPFVVPFSRTANQAGKIVKKHLSDLQKTLEDTHHSDFLDYDIVMAYSKHKSLANELTSSKTLPPPPLHT